jgi:hypothetical protein
MMYRVRKQFHRPTRTHRVKTKYHRPSERSRVLMALDELEMFCTEGKDAATRQTDLDGPELPCLWGRTVGGREDQD